MRLFFNKNPVKVTITASDLHLWSFRVKSKQGKSFRHWLAKVVLPYLRKHNIYVAGTADS
jgi:prophage antirepressor-like protein